MELNPGTAKRIPCTPDNLDRQRKIFHPQEQNKIKGVKKFYIKVVN
jgi:hypothetical protein